MHVNDVRLQELLDAYVDGRLTPETTAELEDRLRSSAEARKQFWEQTVMHGLTLEAAQLKWSAVPTWTPRPRAGLGGILSRWFNPQWRWAWAAAVVVLAAALAV